MKSSVRLAVVGDEGVGKTSLVCALLHGPTTGAVARVHVPVSIPGALAPDGVASLIVDTSSRPGDAAETEAAVRAADAVCLVYAVDSDDSFARVSAHWLPWLGEVAPSVPVVLVGNKIDTRDGAPDDPAANAAFEAQILPVMTRFAAVETCVECSAATATNVAEVFFFALRAVVYPTGPVYDAQTQALRPQCVSALARIFRLADRDRDGALSDEELNDLQRAVFGSPMDAGEIRGLRDLLADAALSRAETLVADAGITLAGFLELQTLFVQRGRLEITWGVLRAHGYTDMLEIDKSLTHPHVDIPPGHRAELSDAGVDFLVDLFWRCDADGDGALSPSELADLLGTCCADVWRPYGYPCSARTVSAGMPDDLDAEECLPLDAFVAQWAMAVAMHPADALAHLAHLGYPLRTLASALRVVDSRTAAARERRGVLVALVLGSAGCGKTSILRTLVGRPFSEGYVPTAGSAYAAAPVSLGGETKHLVLWELTTDGADADVLSDPARMAPVDAVLYVYDSSDAHSFRHVLRLRAAHALLSSLPGVLVAAKADAPAIVQQAPRPPADLALAEMALPAPVACSAALGDTAEVLDAALRAAVGVSLAQTPALSDARDAPGGGHGRRLLAIAAVAAAAAVLVALWYRRTRQ